jgi:hypothetical protein
MPAALCAARETFRRTQNALNISLKTLEKLTPPRSGEKLIAQSTTIGLSNGQAWWRKRFAGAALRLRKFAVE